MQSLATGAMTAATSLAQAGPRSNAPAEAPLSLESQSYALERGGNCGGRVERRRPGDVRGDDACERTAGATVAPRT
jgi:hypothetical protein